MVPIPPDPAAVTAEYNELIATLANRCAVFAGMVATLQKELAAERAKNQPTQEAQQ